MGVFQAMTFPPHSGCKMENANLEGHTGSQCTANLPPKGQDCLDFAGDLCTAK